MFMKNRNTFVLTLAILAATAMASTANAATITDDFSVAHDYSGGSVAGTIWDGIRYNEGNVSSVVANANTSSAGELQFESANGDWQDAPNDGLFLYLNVTGDFIATVDVSAPYVHFNTVGIMARDGGAATENWVSAHILANFGVGETLRSNDDDVSASPDDGQDNGDTGTLRLERVGDTFTAYRYDGVSFVFLNSVVRTDLPGTLQIGLFQATFSSNVGTGTLDNFSLTMPSAEVPTPAALPAGLILLGTLALRRRTQRNI